MQILRVLLETIEAAFLDGSVILSIGKSSGSSALKSQTTGDGSGEINAKQCSMFDDMERLILASFVATRNILSDAAMSAGSENMVNLVTGSDWRPKPGTGQFVLSVPSVQTFSLTGIVSLASILGFLALANLSIWLLVHFHQGRGKRSSPDWGHQVGPFPGPRGRPVVPLRVRAGRGEAVAGLERREAGS